MVEKAAAIGSIPAGALVENPWNSPSLSLAESQSPDRFFPSNFQNSNVGEAEGLKSLESWLIENVPASAEDQVAQFVMVEHLARQYLQREEIQLAESTYDLLAKVAALSPYEEVFRRRRLYDGFRLLMGEEEIGAREALSEVADLPEAKSVLETLETLDRVQIERMDHDRARMLGLSNLDIWAAYVDEGEAYEMDQAKGVLGVSIGVIRYYCEADHRTMLDHVAAKWNLDRDLIREVRRRIQDDELESVEEALTQIGSDPGRFRQRAQDLLDEAKQSDNSGSYLLAHLIRYTGKEGGDPKLLRYLMMDADNLGSRAGAVQTPYAIYSLLQSLGTDESVKTECVQRKKALEEGKGLPGIVWDLIRTTGTDDLVQVATMAGASKIGSIARVAALGRMEKAGITGYKALALAYGASIGAEGTALWAMNTVHQSMLHDTERVFETKKLLGSWGANVMMIAGLKGANGMAEKFAPRIAQFLEFSERKAAYQGGTRTVWGLQHLAGIGAMVGTSQVNQNVGLSDKPKGGFKESLANDLFAYFKYGIAQKGVGNLLGVAIRSKEKALLNATPANPSRKAQVLYAHPLLAPFWMAMGVDGLGGPYRSRDSQVRATRSLNTKAQSQIAEFLDFQEKRRLPPQATLDIEEAWEARIRQALGIKGEEGVKGFFHREAMEKIFSDSARASRVRGILDLEEMPAEWRLRFQKRWSRELESGNCAAILAQLRSEQWNAQDYLETLQTINLLVDHLRYGPVPEPAPPPEPPAPPPPAPNSWERTKLWVLGIWEKLASKPENPVDWETKLKIVDHLMVTEGREMPSQDKLDIEAALEMRIRVPLGLEGRVGGDLVADFHRDRLNQALSDPQRAPNVRRVLKMEITLEQRLNFQRHWGAELNRRGVSGVLDRLVDLRHESPEAYMKSLETVLLLVEHLRWGPVPEPR